MAARHADWKHTHVLGADRDAAAPYLPEARKLLGMVAEDAAHNQLQTHQMTRHLDDGAIIVAEIRGGVPRVTIAPPGAGPATSEPLRVKEQFVIRMRDESLPDGIDPDVPETMEGVAGDAWRTLFHTQSTPGYASFPGKKGTYRRQGSRDVFPEGVNCAGNIDWVGEDGGRVSWYGPSTRYFFDPYVKPRSQYGTYVFMLGQILLDVDDYIDASAPDAAFESRWVLGAALRSPSELLVVHATLPEPTWPTGTAPAGDYRMEMPWPVGDVSTEVCSYALAPTEGESAPFVRVVAGSRTVLSSGIVRNGYNPWFFNASCSAVVNCGLPDNVYAQADPSNPSSIRVPRPPLPSATSAITTAVWTDDSYALSTVHVQLAPDSRATLACDFKGDTLVQMEAVRDRGREGYDTRHIAMGGAQVGVRETYDFRDISGRPGSTFDRRHLVWADLRDDVMVFHAMRQWVRLNAASVTVYHRLEIYRNGALEGVLNYPLRSNTGEFSGLPRLVSEYSPASEDAAQNILRDLPVAPGQALYEILDWSPAASFRTYWQGAHGLYLNLAYPAAEYFGSVVEGRNPAGNPYVELSAGTTPQYNYVQQDVTGHYNVVGAASYDGTLVLSGWRLNLGGFVEDPHAVTLTFPWREGFPMLGGVETRCNPVWLLGTIKR